MTYISPLPWRRWSMMAVGVATAVVLAMGAGAVPASSAAIDSGAWARVGDISIEQANHLVVPLSDGRALLVDAYRRQPPAELYDPETRMWQAAAAPRLAYSGNDPAVMLADGRTLLVGGSISGENGAVGEIYDPAADSWTTTGPLNLPRVADASATLLSDGRVLVVGGRIDDGARFTTATSRAEIYDPVTDTWTEAGDSGVARYRHAAVLLRDGTVLVAGGFGSAGAGTATQVFDPTTGIWSSTGTASSVLSGPGFLLVDGTALVDGEIYDPVTGSWTPTNDTFGGAQVQLVDGRILAVGFSDTRIYDIGTRTWTVVGGVPQNWGASPVTDLPRVSYSLTALRDGTVLTTGGFEYDYVFFSTPHFKDAHVFTP